MILADFRESRMFTLYAHSAARDWAKGVIFRTPGLQVSTFPTLPRYSVQLLLLRHRCVRCFLVVDYRSLTLRTCIWQQIRVSKRLVPASPFTCYIFHGFATPFSGCIIIFLKDFLLAQLSLRLHGLSTRLCSRRKSAVRA